MGDQCCLRPRLRPNRLCQDGDGLRASTHAQAQHWHGRHCQRRPVEHRLRPDCSRSAGPDLCR
eukprot:8571016-Lingulodinium_polyedra.AAC.1